MYETKTEFVFSLSSVKFWCHSLSLHLWRRDRALLLLSRKEMLVPSWTENEESPILIVRTLLVQTLYQETENVERLPFAKMNHCELILQVHEYLSELRFNAVHSILCEKSILPSPKLTLIFLKSLLISYEKSPSKKITSHTCTARIHNEQVLKNFAFNKYTHYSWVQRIPPTNQR